MKKTLKQLYIIALALFVLQGCDRATDSRFQVSPNTGWIEFQGNGATTISLVTETLELPLDINVPVYPGGLTVNYTLEEVQGDFSQIVDTDDSVFISAESNFRAGAVELAFSNLDQLTDVVIFDVVLTSVEGGPVTVGVDENSVTRFRISTPCPIVLSDGDTFTGTDVIYNATPAPTGYTSTLTVDSAADNIYSLDTVWGPEFISVLCGGCVPVGDYIAPITFQIDPGTFDIVILAGGEPAGVGNTFDIPYSVSGVGSYDSCNNVLTFDMEQDLLTTGGVPGTADAVLTGN